jgi:hypothetical protein
VIARWLISEEGTSKPDPPWGEDQASPEELRFQKSKNFFQNNSHLLPFLVGMGIHGDGCWRGGM